MAKRILLITRKFPPAAGGGMPRMASFATRLQKYGWIPTVITPCVEDGWTDQEKALLVQDIDVLRIGKLTRKRRSLKEKVIGRLLPLDSDFLWAKTVIRNLNRKEITPFDLVFTSGPPHSVHYVGSYLKRRHELNWIADFRDQFTLSPTYATYSPINRWYNPRFEQHIYDVADRIITNTRINRRQVLKHFKIKNPKKFITINNGFDPDELRVEGCPPPWSESPIAHFNYVYLGGLRGAHIDRYFFDGFKTALTQSPQLVHELKIRIVGDTRHISPLVQQLVDRGIVSIHEPVPLSSVADVLAHADGGLSWQGGFENYRGMIVQKFFEYFGTQTPMFIVGRPDGEMGNLLRRYDLGRSANPDCESDVAREFIAFHEAVKRGRFGFSSCPERLKNQFNRQFQAEKLARVLNETSRAFES